MEGTTIHKQVFKKTKTLRSAFSMTKILRTKQPVHVLVGNTVTSSCLLCRYLHGASDRSLSSLDRADTSTAWAHRGCALRVWAQRTQAGFSRLWRTERPARIKALSVRQLCLIQPRASFACRRSSCASAHSWRACPLWGQRDTLNVQLCLPLLDSGSQITPREKGKKKKCTHMLQRTAWLCSAPHWQGSPWRA